LRIGVGSHFTILEKRLPTPLRSQPGQFESKRRSVALALTLREHAAAMRARDRADDVQTKARALDVAEPASLDAIEAVEDPLQLLLRNADAAILDADPYRVGGRCGDRDRHLNRLAGVLDRVVEQIGDDGAELLGVADDRERPAVGRL